MDDYIDLGTGLEDFVEGAGSGDFRDDAEVEVWACGGVVGADLVGFGAGADDGKDGEVGGEELGEDVCA